MIVYKLTDADGYTRRGQTGETRWGADVTHTAPGTGDLCTAGWLHAYGDPLVALLRNPADGAYDPATLRLWEAEAGDPIKDDRGLKLGAARLTTVREIAVPHVPPAARVRWAILCALEVYPLWRTADHEARWRAWADAWLGGHDRSAAATAAAADAYAADAAAAAYAAYAAYAADAAAAAAAAAYIGACAADAAAAAAYAAYAADAGQRPLDVAALARRAVREVAR